MSDKKIAFIICVNDEEEFMECMYYLNQLNIPDGYSIDVISIREAPSMTAGYNAGMRSSDARYKVYMHQDVFVLNKDFIKDMVHIFDCDKKIGLLGMVGNRNVGKGVAELTGWDTGLIRDNYKCWNPGVPSKEDVFTEVQAVDGLLMVTQQDISWREDLFDGWHFYDFSQCMEFKRAGYKVVVPWQEKAWCYHDNLYSDLSDYYDKYELFIHEYAEFPWAITSPDESNSGHKIEKEWVKIVETMQSGIEELFMAEAQTELRKLFQKPNIKGETCLKEYETIVAIDHLEKAEQSEICFWETGMSVFQLLLKLRRLKHILKRMEYNADENETVKMQYSKYAVRIVCERYSIDVVKKYEESGRVVL